MSSRTSILVKPTDSSWLVELESTLRIEHGQPRHGNSVRPLDDPIFVVLSRMTQKFEYVRTYRMSRWQGVRDSPHEEVEAVLQDAGLAVTKTQQIKEMLHEVEAREGRLSLARLQKLDDAHVEQYLTSLPGVSVKTARCVMLYSLDRNTLPVDAHVWRIARRLHLVDDKPWTSAPGRGSRFLHRIDVCGHLHYADPPNYLETPK